MAEQVPNRRRNRQHIDASTSGHGLRSRRGSGGRTRDQLYEEARRRNVKGRSRMTREQLLEAIGR